MQNNRSRSHKDRMTKIAIEEGVSDTNVEDFLF